MSKADEFQVRSSTAVVGKLQYMWREFTRMDCVRVVRIKEYHCKPNCPGRAVPARTQAAPAASPTPPSSSSQPALASHFTLQVFHTAGCTL